MKLEVLKLTGIKSTWIYHPSLYHRFDTTEKYHPKYSTNVSGNLIYELLVSFAKL